MQKEIKFIVICGPSGVGKTSIASFLLKKIPNSEFCVSHTTRKPRITEMDGIDYYFVSEEKFDKMKEKGEFAEHAQVYGHQYGTAWNIIQENNYNAIKILDVDYNGAMAIYKKYQNSAIVLSILPPSIEELEERLKDRGTDSGEVIKKRIESVKQELQYEMEIPHFKIINEDMRKTQNEVMKCLQVK